MQGVNDGIVALIDVSDASFDLLTKCDFGGNKLAEFSSGAELIKKYEKLRLNIVAIISESEVMGTSGVSMWETLKQRGMGSVPFFLLSEKISDNLNKISLQAGVAEIFGKPLAKEQMEKRINFLLKHWSALQKKTDKKVTPAYKTGLLKRSFDIISSGLALIVLSPLILVVVIIMKLESEGPVLYYSLRVGTGYKVFKFYKFRSMFVNADKKLKDLKHLNQYDTSEKVVQIEQGALCADCIAAKETKCRNPLYSDKNTWCEKQYLGNKKQQAGSAFFKLKNDPRITKVGHFIRNTSIDELPQLWNVLKGDMSIVGNRPLPLYEAEKLTTDKYAQRFLAPAGLTGLWQVEKRGKGEMSEEERLMLDNTYAENHSFWYDMKLIFKTIPALFQKENV